MSKTLESIRKPAAKKQSQRRDLALDRIAAILKALDEAYPNVECALTHRTPAATAKATLPQLEALIRTTGFFRNKAKSIQGAARKIISDFAGQVPETLAELITIPGAARKTANVVLGVSFGKAEGVVVDTHVFRIARRLGLAKGETPQKVEQELMQVIPQDRWIAFSHQLIHHGRQVCVARKPKCDRCNLEQLCHSKDKTWHS